MDDYKIHLYRNYYSTHNQVLYGDASIDDIRNMYNVWDYYYKRHLPVEKDAQILEIGCGDGGFIQYLNDLGYISSVGVDLSEEQIAVGQKRGIKNLILEDARDFLSPRLEKFDLIIARDVIEHFAKQDAFDIVFLINKALKRGGKFLMQVPNGQGLFYSSIFYGDFTHEVAYTASSAGQLFLNTGFSKSAYYGTGPVPHSLTGRLRSYLWRLKVLQVKFWKMIETGNASGIFTANLIAVAEK
jgi:2-polyprenyl-3-methyl-5-hydroxy-6-metoxy-1,4-benzoquinol methylase